MGLFSKLFGKEEETPQAPTGETLYAVAQGELEPISAVPDDAFASKVLGDGYAIKPSSHEVYAPLAGKVANIFPTHHALMLVTDSGLEVLLHMGIDTVELKGGPFEMKVAVDDRVERGTLVATMNLEEVKAAGKETDIMVVFTNQAKVKSLTLSEPGAVEANAEVGTIIAQE